MKKELLMSTSKATSIDDLPANFSKDSVDLFVGDFIVLINDCLERGIFSGEPEIGTVSLIFKKFESLDEENYCRVKLPSLAFTFCVCV